MHISCNPSFVLHQISDCFRGEMVSVFGDKPPRNAELPFNTGASCGSHITITRHFSQFGINRPRARPPLQRIHCFVPFRSEISVIIAPTPVLHMLYNEISANQSIKTMAKNKWEIEWKTGRENARRLRNMSQHPGTTTGLKLYGILPRKHVVWTTRLRTGHCHLNEYLHRFNIIETPRMRMRCRKGNCKPLSIKL